MKLKLKRTLATLLAALTLAGAAPLPALAQKATAETAQTAVWDAAGIAQQTVLDEVRMLRPDVDYKEHCALFFADDQAAAQAVADALGVRLAEYFYGAASLDFDGTLAALLQTALQTGGLPVLYSNHIYAMEQPAADTAAQGLQTWDAAGLTGYNDPLLASQWYHGYLGSADAWQAGVLGSGVTVAVLDSGVMYNHPDLRVARYVDCLGRWSAEGGNDAYDHNGHGTQVAGTIAAIANNGQGGVGIAPGVTLLSCKVSNTAGDFYDDAIYRGIYTAVDAGADVINISCNYPNDPGGLLRNAIDYATAHGCVIVAAAGNDSKDTPDFLPADAQVIGVGAVGRSGLRLAYSNGGANVDIAAPGEQLYTTHADGGYTSLFGATSGAAAIVSGAAALAIAAEADLLATAQNGTGSLQGAAFVQAVRARLCSAVQGITNDPNGYGSGCLSITKLIANAKPADEAKVTAFVTRLYSVCLDRTPDAAGLADWRNRLTNHQVSGTEVAYGFVFSEEYRAKNYCNDCYVENLYRAIMGRSADAAGKADWLRRLGGGATREAVFNGFAQSDEFRALCNDYGVLVGDAVALPQYGAVPTGACPNDGTPDGVTAFVTRLYSVCLDRTPDTAGLRNWTQQLWSHANSGVGTARGFVFSAEFANKHYSDKEFVERLYTALMGRQSDASGKADWLARMAGGLRREQVFDGFANSTEFTNLCAAYGIRRG